jgi:hypothetical protein
MPPHNDTYEKIKKLISATDTSMKIEDLDQDLGYYNGKSNTVTVSLGSQTLGTIGATPGSGTLITGTPVDTSIVDIASKSYVDNFLDNIPKEKLYEKFDIRLEWDGTRYVVIPTDGTSIHIPVAIYPDEIHSKYAVILRGKDEYSISSTLRDAVIKAKEALQL